MRSHFRLVCWFMLAVTGLLHAQIQSQLPAPWSALEPQRTFPSDSGMTNIKTSYHAAGDGITDDTTVIQAAISAQIRKQTTSRIIYFFAGIYRYHR